MHNTFSTVNVFCEIVEERFEIGKKLRISKIDQSFPEKKNISVKG